MNDQVVYWVVAWLVVSAGVALLTGAVIRRRERQVPSDRPAPEPPVPGPPGWSQEHPRVLVDPDRPGQDGRLPARLNVNISGATEAALTAVRDREGVSMTEATRWLVYQAAAGGRTVLLRGPHDREEQVVLLDPPAGEGGPR